MEKDIYGSTSLDDAKRCQHDDVVEFLESYINSEMATQAKK